MDALFGVIGLMGFIIFLGVLVFFSIKKKPKKVPLIGLAVCFVLLVAGLSMDSTPTTDTTAETKGTTKEEVKEERVDKAKVTATATDKLIYDIVLKSEQNTKLLQEAADLVGNGEATLLDMYDIAKQVKDNQQTYFGALMDLQDKTNEEYIGASKSYVSKAKSVSSLSLIHI